MQSIDEVEVCLATFKIIEAQKLDQILQSKPIIWHKTDGWTLNI